MLLKEKMICLGLEPVYLCRITSALITDPKQKIKKIIGDHKGKKSVLKVKMIQRNIHRRVMRARFPCVAKFVLTSEEIIFPMKLREKLFL